jgi:hypothetical protein
MSKPTIKQTVAGREYSLRLDFNAIGRAEEITGKNFLDGRFWSSLDVRSVTALFFACVFAHFLHVRQGDEAKALQDCQATKATLYDIRSLGPNSMDELVTACNAAWKATTEVPEDEAKRPIDG